MNIRLSRSILLFHAAALALAPLASTAIERISVQGNGGESNGQSRYPAISGDGRYVVFNSDASNLVAGDTNGMADLFVRDRVLGTTTRISVGANGAQGDGPSYTAAISGDGSRIVFASHAHLLPASGYQNCYLLDRSAQTLQVLDLLPNGQPATTCASASIDYAGTKVAVVSLDPLDAVDTGGYDVYVRPLGGSTLTRVSRAPGGGPTNGSNTDARLSGDGSRVIFASSATNLVAGDTNGETDIFLAATDNSVPTVRVNVGPGNTQASAPGGTGTGLLIRTGRVRVLVAARTAWSTGSLGGSAGLLIRRVARPSRVRSPGAPRYLGYMGLTWFDLVYLGTCTALILIAAGCRLLFRRNVEWI